MKASAPLVVDLDGSLLRTDTLHEQFAAALTRPVVVAGTLWKLATRGRAAMKRHLAMGVTLEANLLPTNKAVLALVRSESARGRAIVLATGADSHVADQMVKEIPELAASFASDGTVNLTSGRKADLLVREFGTNGFDYVGNSPKDRAVWGHARNAYLATTRRASAKSPRWSRGIEFSAVLRDDSGPTWRLWVRELRIHQSLKNVLLFLPILAAHDFGDIAAIVNLVAGFLAFTLMASSVYLLNDVLDLRSDRLHARKASRPIAAGRILPGHAVVASAALAVLSVVLALAIGGAFTLVLILYALLTLLYSVVLKRVTLIDVVVLAMLYMIRILAGAVIAGVELSFWFTAVALFLFISLALVKRYTELSRHAAVSDGASLPGRGYVGADAAIVLPLGIGAGMAVLVLLAIYLQTDAVARLYPSAELLWLVIPAMFYWIANIWIQAGRGTIHDDPIVFAFRNRASLVSAATIALLFVAASTSVADSVRAAIPWIWPA